MTIHIHGTTVICLLFPVAAPPPMAGYVTPMPQIGGPMGMGMKHPNEGVSEEEPSNKKLRNEDSLIPEEVFLARNAVSNTLLFYFCKTSLF